MNQLPFHCRLCDGPTDDRSWRVIYHRLGGQDAHVAIFCTVCLDDVLTRTVRACESLELRGGLGTGEQESPRLDQVMHVLEPDLRSDADMPPRDGRADVCSHAAADLSGVIL